jgi:hypothetical protein
MASRAPLLDRLAEAVDKRGGGLVEIPLQVTDHTRAVVEHTEQERRLPAAVRAHDLARAVVEVRVPETVDVLGLVAADFARLQRLTCSRCAGTSPAALPLEPLGLEVSPNAVDRSNGSERELLPGQGLEVVGVELRAPARVGVVLGHQNLAKSVAEARLLSRILANLATQTRHGVFGLPRLIEPPLDRGAAKTHGASGDGMTPGLLGQPRELRREVSARRWCR